MPRPPRYRLTWHDSTEYPADREHHDGDVCRAERVEEFDTRDDAVAAGMARIKARADFFGQVEIERLEWLPDPDFGLPEWTATYRWYIDDDGLGDGYAIDCGSDA